MNRLNNAILTLHDMDRLAARDTWMAEISPEIKIISALGYIAATLSFEPHDLSGVLGMSLYLIILFQAGELPFLRCVKQFGRILAVLSAVGLLNLFWDHELAFYIGKIPITSGILSMAVLLLKGLFSFMAGYLLMASTGIEGICMGLQKLHVPRLMILFLLLIYRYLICLLQTGSRTVTAYGLRAPDQKGIHVRAWGSLAGHMLLRSIDRAQNVYESMLLRGFEGDFRCVGGRKFRRMQSSCFLVGTALFCVVFRVVPVFEWIGLLF